MKHLHFRNFVLVGRQGHDRIMKGGLQPQHISALLRSAKGQPEMGHGPWAGG
jgi:hypothetical protein